MFQGQNILPAETLLHRRPLKKKSLIYVLVFQRERGFTQQSKEKDIF